MNFIEELYYGNINPHGKRLDYNARYAKLLGRLRENEDKLTRLLTNEELEVFCELINLNEEILNISCAEEFKRGFSMGIKMMCDGFSICKNNNFG